MPAGQRFLLRQIDQTGGSFWRRVLGHRYPAHRPHPAREETTPAQPDRAAFLREQLHRTGQMPRCHAIAFLPPSIPKQPDVLIFRVLFARTGTLSSHFPPQLPAAFAGFFSSLSCSSIKLDRAIRLTFVGFMIRIDLTRWSLSLGLLGVQVCSAIGLPGGGASASSFKIPLRTAFGSRCAKSPIPADWTILP